MTYLLVTAGAVVCATGSTLGCPDWPRCYGHLLPRLRIDSVIEYSHRLLAALTLPLLIACAAVAWQARSRWLRAAPLVTLVLFFAVAAFGARAVLHGLPRWAAAIDVGSALLALAIMSWAVTAVTHESRGGPLLKRGPAPLALGATAAVYIVLVSGVLVAAPGSLTRCLGFPLFSSSSVVADLGGWPAATRRIVAGAAVVLCVALALRLQRESDVRARHLAYAAVTALGCELATGVLLVQTDFPLGLRMLYVALATALWALLNATLAATVFSTAARSVQNALLSRNDRQRDVRRVRRAVASLLMRCDKRRVALVVPVGVEVAIVLREQRRRSPTLARRRSGNAPAVRARNRSCSH